MCLKKWLEVPFLRAENSYNRSWVKNNIIHNGACGYLRNNVEIIPKLACSSVLIHVDGVLAIIVHVLR